MAKKRAKVSDLRKEITSVDSDLFAKTTPDAKKEKERKRQRGRLTKRATYDITPELKQAIVKRATRLGIPASQLAMFFLCDSLRRYDAGEIDPAPFLSESESPKFRNNLDFDDWYNFEGDD